MSRGVSKDQPFERLLQRKATTPSGPRQVEKSAGSLHLIVRSRLTRNIGLRGR
jgi:hypothetical protein